MSFTSPASAQRLRATVSQLSACGPSIVSSFDDTRRLARRVSHSARHADPAHAEGRHSRSGTCSQGSQSHTSYPEAKCSRSASRDSHSAQRDTAPSPSHWSQSLSSSAAELWGAEGSGAAYVCAGFLLCDRNGASPASLVSPRYEQFVTVSATSASLGSDPVDISFLTRSGRSSVNVQTLYDIIIGARLDSGWSSWSTSLFVVPLDRAPRSYRSAVSSASASEDDSSRRDRASLRFAPRSGAEANGAFDAASGSQQRRDGTWSQPLVAITCAAGVSERLKASTS